jgi:hypothetical protein
MRKDLADSLLARDWNVLDWLASTQAEAHFDPTSGNE